MADLSFRVLPLLDYGATFAWASSGALVGIQKRFDIIGVFVIALLSSTGGSLMRDGLFLQRTPPLLRNPVYLPLILVAATLTSLFTHRLRYIFGVAKLIDIIDGVGIPAFAVIGMQLAQESGVPLPGVVFIGVVNGVGGGLLRDVVVGEVPALLRPGQFSTLSLILVCGLFLLLTVRAGVRAAQAAPITVAVFFIIRLLTVRFNWRTRSVGQAS
jgi:uncharacterized membrane protein YeiH